MKFKHRIQLEKAQVEIAPLIDCVFLLLIFFLLTSNFIFQPGIKINLPKAVTSEVIQERSIIITITKENLIYFNERVVSTAELKENLRSASKQNKPILIKADRTVSLGQVINIWDLCRDAGVSQINIATNQEIQ